MDTPKIIMLVDDNTTNLRIGLNALGGMYTVFTMPSGATLFTMLEKVTPDLILLDVEMPEMDGYEVIRKLKETAATAGIPVIFLTARNDPGSELEGLTLGAVDYIAKPFSPPILQKRVKTHLLLKRYNDRLLDMVDEKTRTITDLQNALLSTVAEIVEYRDAVTGDHIERTQEYLACIVGKMMHRGIYREITDGWDLDFLFQSASLHDVGKIFIPDSILMKPGKLTVEEFETMKHHAVHGVTIIEKMEKSAAVREFLHHAKVFAETHHERWDGTGYPTGLAGEAIPLQGRLMAIVDVYDALVSNRPYKPAFSHADAVGIISSGSGSHFDPVLVELFLASAEEFSRIASEFPVRK